MFKSVRIGVLALMLAACGAPRPRSVAPPNPGERASTANLPLTGSVYRIDESRSELRILVYRAGPLARLGHNHVLVNRSIRGAVNVADSQGASAFWMNVPAAGFVVDDEPARRQEGSDFSAEVSDDAKSGTLRNMLSTALLDADEFPMIIVNGVAAAGALDAPGKVLLVASLVIDVAGHESTIDVPFTLEIDSNGLSASGSLELRQSALGLTPYSLMLGALQVQDAMIIKFDIVAGSG